MTPSTRFDPQRLLIEEQLDVMEEFERTMARRHGLPRRDRLLSRHVATLLQWAGGLVLALNVAIVAILICFIVMNLMIHVSP